MVNDIEKIREAKEIVSKLASGVNPVNGDEIKNDNILNNPQMIRCLFFVSDVLENVAAGGYSKAAKKMTKFIMNANQKENVVFTEGEIGVNEIAKCINNNINPLISKKVSGNIISRGLKKMGVLAEIENEDKTKRTAVNNSSINLGFSEVKRSYNGNEYFQVVANDEGKKFILDNIKEIMGAASKKK